MRKILVILLLNFILIPIKSYPEYWGELEIKKSLSEKLIFEVNSRVKFSSALSGFYGYRTEIGPVFQIDKFKGAGFYFVNEEKWREGKWQSTTNSLGASMGLSYKFFILQMMDQNRIDYHALELWVYRNLLTIRGTPYVTYEWSIYYGQPPITCRLAPCLENELFYNINETKVNENRLLIGIYYEMVPYLSLKLGYMLQSEKGEEWQNKGVIVTTLEILFLEIE